MAGFELFGYQIAKKSKEQDEKDKATSFVPPNENDGSMIVADGNFSGAIYDVNGGISNEADLITKYREMALYPDVEYAVDDIVNEAITVENGRDVVTFNMDSFESGSAFSKKDIQKKVGEEFKHIIELIDFNNNAYEIFKRWYVDGRLYYHIIPAKNIKQDGILELRYIDPRKIRKIKQVKRTNDTKVGVSLFQTDSEYYVFSSTGFGKSINDGVQQRFDGSTYGLKINSDAIIYAHSGLTDPTGNMILSYLHKAMRVLNALKSLEDSVVIYRYTRAPERRIFYIDVGNLPPAKAEQYMNNMMVRHKNKLVFDPSTGKISDDRRFMCYAMDTLIPLLDGRTLTLQEITDEYESGKQNWVYSCDPATGKFAPGPVSWAGITKTNSQVVRVTFDNGKSVVCTPDHKFPVWGKGFVEAKDLIGESVIPGYRRMKSITHDGKGSLYEQIYRNEDKKWVFTHREVADWKDKNNLREEMTYISSYEGEKNTIHHRDYNRYNNSPDNLLRMHKHDHIKFHSDYARGKFKPNRSEDFTLEWKTNLSISAKRRGAHKIHIKTWKITTPGKEQLIIENLSEYCRNEKLNRSNIKGRFGSKGYHAEELRNHKAVSVEWLNENIDVGCLTVDLEETYHSNHTYLLDVGVYTKNTMYEDYWFPRREGGKGTEIKTLEGGQNLGELSDVEYFQQKLYRALGVPVSRMNPDTAGFTFSKAAEISRDEVKFSKFIDRLRRRFSLLLFDALAKQLIMKGIISQDDVPELYRGGYFEFSSDNHFAEVKDNEILSRRIEVAKDLQDFVGIYFSHEFVRRKVFKQTDEEVEEQDKLINTEKSDERFMNPVQVDDPTFGSNAMQGGDQPPPIQNKSVNPFEQNVEDPPRDPQSS